MIAVWLTALRPQTVRATLGRSWSSATTATRLLPITNTRCTSPLVAGNTNVGGSVAWIHVAIPSSQSQDPPQLPQNPPVVNSTEENPAANINTEHNKVQDEPYGGWRPTFDTNNRAIIQERDIVVKFITGSGNGGQKLNKTSSCVQIRHIPTGIVVKSQLTRVQHINERDARRLLQAKLEDIFLGNQSRNALKRDKERRHSQARDNKVRRKQRELDNIIDNLKRKRDENNLTDTKLDTDTVVDATTVDTASNREPTNEIQQDDNVINNKQVSVDKGIIAVEDLDLVAKYDPNDPLGSMPPLSQLEQDAELRREARKVLRLAVPDSKNQKRQHIATRKSRKNPYRR